MMTKKILKSCKYKIYPTEEQKILLNKHFGSIRYVYNYFLNQRKEEYLNSKKSLNYYTQAKYLTELKQLKETKWLNEVNSQSLQDSLHCLENAYINFFRKKAQFPRFKSKKNRNSFTVPQHIFIENNKIYVPKFKEGIKINIHKHIEGKIKRCTFSLSASDKYFVSVLFETEHEILPKTNKSIGIDLGVKDLVITSDNFKYKNNKYFKKYEKQLAKAQKHLSRKQKDSNRYEKQRLKVAKIYEKITNSRNDALHKISIDLIRKYDTICVESLSIKKMLKDKDHAKNISDAAFGTLISMLQYKAEWNNKEIIKIDKYFPSSKLCNKCKYINEDLKLKDRVWTCPKCNTFHDRDLNASYNILERGLTIKSIGTIDYTRGDDVRRSRNTVRLPKKREAI